MYAMIRTLEMIRTIANPKRRNEEGASAVEYGLLVALIAAVIVVAVTLLGDTLTGIFEGVEASIK